jgi:hypothetical protein
MNYCQQLWGSWVIYKAHETQYIFERCGQKNSLFLRFRAVFMSYCRQFWGSGLIYNVHDTQYIFEGHDKKFIIFCILRPFSWPTAHFFGGPDWFTKSMTLSTYLRWMTKSSSFLRLAAVFVSYCPLFGVQWRFTSNMTVCTFWRGTIKNS